MQASNSHVVVVIGAGASLAEARGHRPKQGKAHPPLDRNFFARVAKHRRSALLDRVIAQARQLGEPELGREGQVSLEAHLGRLYFEVQHNPYAASVKSYYDVIDLYGGELVATTNWMIGRRGVLRDLLQLESGRHDRVSVVTFNHDLLIENALEELARSRNPVPWSLDTTYGFAPATMISGPEEDFSVGNGPSRIEIHKLHGSLNWVVRIRDYYPPADFLTKDHDVRLITDKRAQPPRQTLGAQRGRRRWYLFPGVVPPVYEKHGLISSLLQQVWENAEAALVNADRVLFWGYSFPQADVHARYFFQRVAERNSALRVPALINPDAQAGAQLWRVLRPERVSHFRDITDYLATP